MPEIEITGILKSFRSDMPDESKTARAVDRGSGIEEIISCTTAEVPTSFAAMPEEAEQERLRD